MNNTVTIRTKTNGIFKFDKVGTVPELQRTYKIGTFLLDDKNEPIDTIEAVTIEAVTIEKL